MNEIEAGFDVRFLGAAFFAARKLCPETDQRMVLRSHLDKLSWWEPGEAGGVAVDLDWFWIVQTKPAPIMEVVIDDEIASHQHIRVVAYPEPTPYPTTGRPTIWLLAVIDKEDDVYSPFEVSTWIFRRALVRRYYDHLTTGLLGFDLPALTWH